MFETAKPFLLSLALGLVLGTERERAMSAKGGHAPFGSRTFTLVALLGTLAAHLQSPGLAVTLAAFVAALTIAAYLRPTAPGTPDPGTTTEVAVVATFVLGWLAHGEPMLTAMIGVIVLAVLWLKRKIHAFAHDGLTDQEVNAALTFLVIAFVVLPLLPNRAIDGWGIINPSRLWLMFVLIAGVGFAGYIAVRALGPARGLAAAGFAAGLVSSTAATLSLSRRSADAPETAGPLATGIVLANVASAAAVIVIASVAAPTLTRPTLLLIGAPVVVGLAGTLLAMWWLRRRELTTAAGEFRLSNPLELKPALAMAAIFGLILLIAAFAQRAFGDSGVLAAAALAGINDVHAATLAAGTLTTAGTIGPHEALLAILIAFLVNMAVKLGITLVVGGRKLFLIAAPPMIAMAASAVLVFRWLPPS